LKKDSHTYAICVQHTGYVIESLRLVERQVNRLNRLVKPSKASERNSIDGECIRQAQIDPVLGSVMKKCSRGQECVVVMCRESQRPSMNRAERAADEWIVCSIY